MFEKLVSQLKLKKEQNPCGSVTSPFTQSKCVAQKTFLKSLSEHALNLYQKKTDIKNFTKLAMSNPEDSSHNDLVKEKELDEFDLLFDLSNNEEFLKDLGL